MRFLLYNVRYGTGSGGRWHLPWGGYPNIIPDLASCYFYLRSTADEVPAAMRRHFADIARGAALMTGTRLELENIVIFLVHLSLSFRTRHHQLNDLFTMVRKVGKPCIVAGDFNAFWGDREIRLFLAATRLVSVFPFGQPTFPSWKPRRQLDFILHSPEIEITNFQLPRVEYSDHLPLVCDFDIN
ncbi:MAG: endonuclease/exonuclease/phosphatase family protein [Lentisphaerae bacterium]|nr:endonuclease/exonuclease/phosphatase family protein [Lentisphaerota bacterium]